MRFLLIFFIFFIKGLLTHQETFSFFVETTSTFLIKTNVLTLQHEEKEVGTVSYLRIPASKYFVIFDLFIDTKHRNRGYGTLLVKEAVKRIKGADLKAKVIVQPGPFELINMKPSQIKGPERSKKIEQLIGFYKALNFTPIQSKILIKFLKLFYMITGIHEDPNFLLITS